MAFHGQPLFLVVAETREAARRAARLARVEIAEEPPLLTIADAMAAGSLLQPPYRMARGDAAADAKNRIVYNETAGVLIHDKNGSAPGKAKVFAAIGTGLDLDHDAFIVI